MAIIPPINPVTAVTTLFGLLGAKKTFDYQKAEAKRRAELGVFDARQKVNELFLAKAQAISEGNRRLEDMERAESQNIAKFSAKISSSDRSVEAFLKKNRKIVAEDLEDLERMSNLQSAKYATAAALDYKYGQGAAAGIRAEANINLLTNLSSLLKNIDLTPRN
tara:strand:+ start:146 stop:637 length:492 start_codon:yes stop_codon:yes gene_type:complete